MDHVFITLGIFGPFECQKSYFFILKNPKEYATFRWYLEWPNLKWPMCFCQKIWLKNRVFRIRPNTSIGRISIGGIAIGQISINRISIGRILKGRIDKKPSGTSLVRSRQGLLIPHHSLRQPSQPFLNSAFFILSVLSLST